MSTQRTNRSSRTIAEPFLGTKMKADVLAIAREHKGPEPDLRRAVVARMKQALAEGRAEAQRLLMEDGLGRTCSQRLSALQEPVIAADFEVDTTIL